jgi:hypothetical protein
MSTSTKCENFQQSATAQFNLYVISMLYLMLDGGKI